MRLIDADALHNFVSEEFKDDVPYEWAWALTTVDYAPAVDAVPVVRCRECVGRPFWEEDHNGVPVCLLSGLYVRSEDDFCSYGEREDGYGND